MKKFGSVMVGALVVLVAFALIAAGISPASTQVAAVGFGKLTNEQMLQIKGANQVKHCSESPYDCPSLTWPQFQCVKFPYEFEATEGAVACPNSSVRIAADANYRTCENSMKENGNEKQCGTAEDRYCAKKIICDSTQLKGVKEDGNCKPDAKASTFCGSCTNGSKDNDPDTKKTHQVCK